MQRSGAPGRARTCDLLIRSQTLYPTELRVLTGADVNWLAQIRQLLDLYFVLSTLCLVLSTLCLVLSTLFRL